MARRYIHVRFPSSTRLYAYVHDGDEEIIAGVDRVEILTKDGLGTFVVQRVSDKRPDVSSNVQFKPIVRVMPRPQKAAQP